MNNGTIIFITISTIAFFIFLFKSWEKHTKFMSKMVFERNMRELFILTDSLSKIKREYPTLFAVVNSFSKVNKNTLEIESIIPHLQKMEDSDSKRLDRELRKAIDSDNINAHAIAMWYMLTSIVLLSYRKPFKYRFLQFMFALKRSSDIDKAVEDNFKNNDAEGLCVV